MFPETYLIRAGKHRLTLVLLAACALALPAVAGAQDSNSKPPQPPAQSQDVPAAGGPQGDVGPIAVPRKKTDEPPAPRREPTVKNPEGMPDFSLRVDVPLVNVDVLVTTKDGQFVPNLQRENFRILEDGVPQKVASFNQGEAPITAVLLVEFAYTNYNFIYDMLNASYTFASTLKPRDWVAVVSYDMKPQIQVDFTQDKRAFMGALGRLRIPGFRETNLFDALYDTLDRLDRLEGRKYVILIASGVDSFSKRTLDDAYKKVKMTPNVTIFTISTGGALRTYAENTGRMGPVTGLEFAQADNQMATFARTTGGRHFKPRFAGEFREIFGAIGNTIRNQYMLSYHSTNPRQDGSYRKIKVELIDPATGVPLKMQNEKGKPLKYNIIAREGYSARQIVE